MKRSGTAIWVSAAVAATLVVFTLVLSTPPRTAERADIAPAAVRTSGGTAPGSGCCEMPAASMTCPPGCPETPTCKPAARAAAAAIASALDAGAPESAANIVPAAPAPAAGGMVVAFDPETGAYGMPTAEQLDALGKSGAEGLNWSSEGLVETRHPDGSVSIDLQGRFQQYTAVNIRPDGSKEFQCGDDPAAHTHHVAASEPVQAPAVMEEE